LRHDKIQYNPENRLFAYLYLENKTFINSHLIKAGLADVDDTIDFKYKEKFRSMQQSPIRLHRRKETGGAF
jgi:site-specific DNA-methyltransferase (adenine-specific)